MKLNINKLTNSRDGSEYYQIHLCEIWIIDTTDPMILGEILDEFIREDYNGQLRAYGEYLKRSETK
jgi:hypothetical protein